MAKRIFVTATNTDIGKTYTTKRLLKEFASAGLRVGVIKPIETGVINGIYPDGNELLTLIQELNPEANPLIDIVYRRSTAEAPQERYMHVSDMIADLTNILEYGELAEDDEVPTLIVGDKHSYAPESMTSEEEEIFLSFHSMAFDREEDNDLSEEQEFADLEKYLSSSSLKAVIDEDEITTIPAEMLDSGEYALSPEDEYEIIHPEFIHNENDIDDAYPTIPAEMLHPADELEVIDDNDHPTIPGKMV